MRGLRVVIPGTATVCSGITERVTWAQCERFMNMHSCTWKGETLAYGGDGGGGGGGEGKGRYLLDDRRVQAVKAAVQPDALKEEKRSC